MKQSSEKREVIVAKTAGFCFGVERAVNEVYKQIQLQKEGETGGPIYTYGPIIHNEEVVRDLEERGVQVLNTPEDLMALPEGTGTVIIRSHGVSKEIYELLKERKIRIVDATCPFVKKIHRIVEEHSKAGETVIIIGNPSHPEVEGIRGWGNGDTIVIENGTQLENLRLPTGQKVCIVSQTTFNYNKFKELVEILRKKRYDNNVLNISNILNTICNATEERQKEAKTIAGEVDTMLVIGGRHSSNTQKLFEICKEECGNTYYIQTPVDLDSEMFHRSSYVGITAGASTPKKIIEEVQEHVRIKF